MDEDLDLEAKTLSALLEDKQIHVLLMANPDILFRTHFDIWEFIRDYYDMNQSLPPGTLVESKFKDFEVIPDVGATKYNLDALRTHYLKSRIRDTLKTVAAKAESGEPKEALGMMTTLAAEISRYTTDVRDIDMIDVEDAVAYFERIEEMARLGLSPGIKTGLKGFDDYLPAGIMPGHLGVFLAYPQIGKSWLMLYMAVQAWKNGKKPMILSLEMSESEVRDRAYTIMANGLFSHRKISAGEIDIDEFKRWGAKNLVGRPSFQVVSNDGGGEVTPSFIRGKIDQYRPDIVFVDYMQLMQSNTKGESEAIRLKNISRELKLLAKSANVPIVVIASATPDDATDMTTVPALGQVRWGKDIAYDADWVLALGREPTSDIIEVCFRKNRHGYLGEFMLEVNFDIGQFRYKDFGDA